MIRILSFFYVFIMVIFSLPRSYDFVIPQDGQWGAEINETGNWTGIVGDLQHKVRLSTTS